MKIEIWSDFVCPFCYIGKRRLEEALSTFPHKDQVEVSYKSFELDPNSQKDSNLSIHEALAKKYGTSIEQAKQMNANVGQQAATVGLDFNFENMKPTNTLDAHRVAKYAQSKGKEEPLTERLLQAYFTDSLHIGNHETLVRLATEEGLDSEEVKAVLNGNDFEELVRKDEAEAREIGVQGVPFFVINQKYAISGAQPTEVFKSALEQVWEEENNKTPLKPIGTSDANGVACTDDGCEVTVDKNNK